MMRREFCVAIFLLPSCCFGFCPAVTRESIACEGFSAQLSCEEGFIDVQSANYGRTDRSTCSRGRPSDQVTNDQCYLPSTLSLMSQRCDGEPRCDIAATNHVFPDPCDGTYKYLNVTYSCAPSKRSISCWGTVSQLSCEEGFINVQSANYGRTDRYTCSEGHPSDQVTNDQCYLPSTLSIMSQRCDGKPQCDVSVVTEVFPDPCYGTFKYLDVQYSCSPYKRSISCWGTVSQLRCEEGFINVRSANYGRTDRYTCSEGRPSDQVTNDQCYLPSTLSIMSQRCDGKPQCDVSVVTDVFPDPCYGTFKYLDVKYSCDP